MDLILKCVQKTKAGIDRYRRRLLKEISGHLGQGEFVKVLGESEREALKTYPKVYARLEQLVENAKREAIPRGIYLI